MINKEKIRHCKKCESLLEYSDFLESWYCEKCDSWQDN